MCFEPHLHLPPSTPTIGHIALLAAFSSTHHDITRNQTKFQIQAAMRCDEDKCVRRKRDIFARQEKTMRITVRGTSAVLPDEHGMGPTTKCKSHTHTPNSINYCCLVSMAFFRFALFSQLTGKSSATASENETKLLRNFVCGFYQY